jgi:hypothetical protein
MGMGMGAPSLPSDTHAAQVVAPQPDFALLGLDKRAHRVPSGQTHFFRCGLLLLLLLFAWDVAGSCLPRAFGLGEEGKACRERCLCASGPGVVGREYGWCRSQSWCSRLSLTRSNWCATATAVVVVGSAGSLDWSAPCQVQCLVQVQLESEWGPEPECAWRKPDQPSGHEYDGHTSRKTQDCIEHPLKRYFSRIPCIPTFPAFPAPIIPGPVPLAHPAWSVGA